MKTLLLALALASAAGESPSAEIVLSRHDGLIVATPRRATPPGTDVVAVTYRWAVDRDGSPLPAASLETDPGGHRLVVAEGPAGSRYHFRLTAEILAGERKTATVDGIERVVYLTPRLRTPEVATRTLVVDGPPIPPPPPPPPPAPSLPPGRFGLAPFLYEAFASQKGLSPAERRGAASALGDAYRGVIERIDGAGGQVVFAVALKDMVDSGRRALGSVHPGPLVLPASGVDPARLAVLKSRLDARLVELVQGPGSRILSTADLGDALREILQGLDALPN